MRLVEARRRPVAQRLALTDVDRLEQVLVGERARATATTGDSKTSPFRPTPPSGHRPPGTRTPSVARARPARRDGGRATR